MRTTQEFEIAYLRLMQRPGADLQPQNTYGRMLLEWKTRGCPDDIEQFIRDRTVLTEPAGHPLLA